MSTAPKRKEEKERWQWKELGKEHRACLAVRSSCFSKFIKLWWSMCTVSPGFPQKKGLKAFNAK